MKRIIDVDENLICEGFVRNFTKEEKDVLINAIRNSIPYEEQPQGECKDCDNCEDKALSYSMGFQDGFLLGGFQLTELRRWLTSQGYSEGTVDDKINEFMRFVEKIRGEE